VSGWGVVVAPKLVDHFFPNAPGGSLPAAKTAQAGCNVWDERTVELPKDANTWMEKTVDPLKSINSDRPSAANIFDTYSLSFVPLKERRDVHFVWCRDVGQNGTGWKIDERRHSDAGVPLKDITDVTGARPIGYFDDQSPTGNNGALWFLRPDAD
jgi:hypothetical protein